MPGDADPMDDDDLYSHFAKTPAAGGPIAGARNTATPTGRPTDPPSQYAPLEGPTAAPGVWCSDCRQVQRAQYWALNDRPLCAKCREPYREKIAYGTGDQAFWRSFAYGAGAAVAGAIVFAVIFGAIGFFRATLSLAVGWAVGTAVSKGNGGFGGRRYQWMAATLTYLAIGFGYLPSALSGLRVTGTVRSALEASAVGSHVLEQQRIHQERQSKQIREIIANTPLDPNAALDAAVNDATAAHATDPDVARRDSLLDRIAPAPKRPTLGPARMLAMSVFLLAILPLASLIGAGSFLVYGAVIGLVALAIGMYKAWTIAEGGPELVLRGPFRIGAGPISPTI
jgi:hypothetical protein